ncbi:hypothetical protein LCGC14_1444700 [marine sediment metagenome]|uniref:Uncharacterized protein n=2 Tax=root TaxID=1 RepID=A0A831QR24_9FLAO|nr:hypothetical protein [Pricia sp.]HEA23334.1 hypothetical protein [Pricia antarctica]
MNEAHFHLIVNHLPIVGVLIGLLVLFIGFILNKPQLKVTALGIFIFSAVASVAAFYSGEGAEDIVENITGISETLIHTHEAYAERFFTSILVLGFVSVVTMFLKIESPKYAKYGFMLILVLSVLSTVLAKYVGTSGGEIRHTEIRTDTTLIEIYSHDDSEDY